MKSYLGYAAAFVLVGGTGAASAQTYYEPDPVGTETIISRPVDITPAQRTTTYRTIIPQGRGRKPIIKERIVTERAAAPIVRQRVVTRAADDYAYVPPAYVPPAPIVRERVVTQPAELDYAYAPGAAVVPAVAPLVQPAYAARPYRYVVNNRVLLIDPATRAVLADITDEPWRY